MGLLSEVTRAPLAYITQMGNDQDPQVGAIYQNNTDIVMDASALLADFKGQPFKIVLKYTKQDI